MSDIQKIASIIESSDVIAADFGARLVSLMMPKRSKEHADRWQLGDGYCDKTAIGIARTVLLYLAQTVTPAEPEPLAFTRIDNDANGNGRYIVHFLKLNTRAEVNNSSLTVPQKYAIACKRANSIGGAKYRGKSYGGGIVFQSCAIDDTAKHIGRVTGREFKAYVD